MSLLASRKPKSNNRAKKIQGAKITPMPAEAVTFTEYLRRKNALLQKGNPDAPIVRYRNLVKAIEDGGIQMFEYGNNKFVDWAAAKDYVFRTWSNPHRQKKNDKKPK